MSSIADNESNRGFTSNIKNRYIKTLDLYGIKGLPNLNNWDGMHMGRTIALKLTDREERIVNRLNRAGISNSELLRDALWKYFKDISEDDETIQAPSIHQPTGTSSPVLQEYITHLKEEIHELRDQNQDFQKQIGEEISRLHTQLYRISTTPETTKTTPSPEKPNPDFHRDIDDFLIKRENTD